MAKWRERELNCAIPTIAERERSERKHGLTGRLLPSCSCAPHSDLHQALAGRFDVPAADRQAGFSRIDVAHPRGLVGQVGDRLVYAVEGS